MGSGKGGKEKGQNRGRMRTRIKEGILRGDNGLHVVETRDGGEGDLKRFLGLRSGAASIAWIVVVNVTKLCSLLHRRTPVDAFGASGCDGCETDHIIHLKC